MAQVQVTMDDDLYEKISKLAEKNTLSISAQIRTLTVTAMDAKDKVMTGAKG